MTNINENVKSILQKLHKEVDSIKYGYGSTRSERKILTEHFEELFISLELELSK